MGLLGYKGYEYFAGSNVLIHVGQGTEKFPLLECAGISVQISESKMPLYGYSSRHFDAVARGQVIVQGSLIINYVHNDYVFRSILEGIKQEDVGEVDFTDEFKEQLSNEYSRSRLAENLTTNYRDNVLLAQALKEKYWRTGINASPTEEFFANPHDLYGSIDIKVTFGDTGSHNNWSGRTGYVISEVFFTGRAQPIQIDESVIIEEHQFFARNIEPIRDAYVTLQTDPEFIENIGGSSTEETTIVTSPIGALGSLLKIRPN